MTRVYAFVVMDLPHIGHIRYLQKARALGDYLIVGVMTDEAAMTYKDRPIMPFEDRKAIVEAIKGVDKVVAQRNKSPVVNAIRYKADIVVHGDDWTKDDFKGIEDTGAKLILTDYHKGISTTDLKRRIKNE